MRNSTSTILRRLSVVLFIGGIAHLLARVLWHFQAFGMNDASVVPFFQVCGEVSASDFSLRSWTECWPAEVQPTSFWEYTSDVGYIIGTHVLGLIGAAIICGILYWVFVDGTIHECRDPLCPCANHLDEAFDEEKREWDVQSCENPECTCRRHRR